MIAWRCRRLGRSVNGLGGRLLRPATRGDGTQFLQASAADDPTSRKAKEDLRHGRARPSLQEG